MQYELNADDTVVSLSGEFTFTDHPVFQEVSKRLLGAHSQPIVIDLTKLEFIDSAGLGMLLIARDETTKVSRKLILRSPQGQVKRMFALTKFDTLFSIES
jgi:anti-anti-sigma factor